MPMPACDSPPDNVVLELTVSHRPGVMSHVCGLLARRAYPMDSILYMPLKDGRYGRIWLRLQKHQRLPTLLQQLRNLEDVLTVRQHSAPHPLFTQLEAWEKTGSAFSDAELSPGDPNAY